MMNRFQLPLIVLILFISCETPFSTKPSNDEDLFVVSHDYDQSPIFHKTPVQVSWSNITIEDFKEFRIEKAKIVGNEYLWTDLAPILAINILIGTKIKNVGIFTNPKLNGALILR